METAAAIIKRFRVRNDAKFRLEDFDPADTAGLDIKKEEAKELLATGIERLRDLQERLFAEGRRSLLIVLQAMDAAGKDSAIEHVMTGLNPQGCVVSSFKAPSTTELRHDFLWRNVVALPERGHIGIFNRSYYEEVLVVRVHRDILDRENLPHSLVADSIWDERYESIRDFEKHLTRNGTTVLKFFLHVSRDEQRRRFLERIDEPEKNWKFNLGDVAERKLWPEYMAAYEQAIRNTATKRAPWYVVPADNKWFSRLFIAATIVGCLEKLDPKFPTVDAEARAAMAKAREDLVAEGPAPSRKKNKQDR
jgi:PPK2 family polyphosphate:nucleotide phosphotransferase